MLRLNYIDAKYVTDILTGHCSAVGRESDCRSRGRKFHPGEVPYPKEIDYEIISTVILLLLLIQEGLLSVTSESMCTKYWLSA